MQLDDWNGARSGRRLRQSLLGATAIIAIAASDAALAQQQEAEDEAAETEDTSLMRIEEVVVLGTPGGGGVRKRDASFAITTIQSEDLTYSAPKSTAEVFKLVPGVWTESSGGVAGANIDVRGLPGGGDAPFVTLSLNGAPIYGTETLSFLEQSSIFRVDETIERVEALRGGPNSVFSNGEPGVTLNFKLKEGGEDTEGRVKYTTSDYALQRLDAVISGKLADRLYYMVGGYVRTSHGIRNAEFNSEEGFQYTINLTKDFDRGRLNLFARVTDDHGQWYLPMALNTGNDLGTFSQLGNATRIRELQVNANGDTETFDFANGRGWDGVVTGLNGEFELGDGFFLRDNASYTNGSADTFGFVPDGSPIQVSALPGGMATTVGGEALSGSEYIQNYGHWVVLKDLESFTNDISLNKQINDHDVTVGYYAATWSSEDFWTLGNFIPVHNVANGDRLANLACQDLQAAGSGGSCFMFGLESAGDARANAIYFADSWQTTPDLRFDFGVRHEWIDLDYVVDFGPGYPDGSRDLSTTLSDKAFSWTVAANYDFNDETGVFARYSDGSLFPHFDDIRENNLNVNGVKQFELGLKHSSDYFGVFLTGFFNKNDSFESVVGGVVPASSFKTRALGLELDGRFTYRDFNVSMIATWQDAEIRNSTTEANVGNRVLRQPNWQVRISPSYNIHFDGGIVATLYGALTAVGDRFSDNANMVELDGYTKLDAGIDVTTPLGIFFQIHADNLNDSHGLTEGDPRNPISPNGRPILGQSFKFSVGYDF